MPRTDTPCEIFRPGRNLPHNECECGWMRIEHVNRPLAVPSLDPMPAIKDDGAKLLSETCDYYRGLLVQIGEMFGKASHTADDGSYSSDVIVAKVPDLVRELLATKGFHSARLPFPPSAMPIPREQKAFLDAVATTGSKASIETVQIAGNPQTVYPDNEKGDSPTKE